MHHPRLFSYRSDIMLTRLKLIAVVFLHLYVILINAVGFFVLPFAAWLIMGWPLWFTVLIVTPLQSIVVYLTFNRQPCPLTNWENDLRKQLGMRPIGGFFGHYIIKQRWRKKDWGKTTTV
jgi:hypothetical protein